MSQYLESLQVGDAIDAKGPTGHVHYLGRGEYTVGGERRRAAHISMIAGGTGITPMYQVIREVLKDAADETQLSLLYANVAPGGASMHPSVAEAFRGRLGGLISQACMPAALWSRPCVMCLGGGGSWLPTAGHAPPRLPGPAPLTPPRPTPHPRPHP